jgi:hypothetical protein
MISYEKRSELRLNYDAFLETLPSVIQDHQGKHALMRHGRIVEYFDSARDALLSGRKQYPDDLFSVQEVTTAKADFGWYSRVPPNPPL